MASKGPRNCGSAALTASTGESPLDQIRHQMGYHLGIGSDPNTRPLACNASRKGGSSR
jgi:hypothetical protein